MVSVLGEVVIASAAKQFSPALWIASLRSQ